MRVAYITAGAAGMYCGSCMHDNTLARALGRLGVDIALVPTYTPTRTDEENVSIDRIFFGGINVYLQEKFALFRHTPQFIDKFFENKRLLNWVSRFSSSTKAADLGALTLSILRGKNGKQKKELHKLVDWLGDDFRPDLVVITNSMFNGFAGLIKERLKLPVLGALQGEDLFLDALIEPYKSKAHKLLQRCAQDIDGFVTNSDYYRDFMAAYLDVAVEKIQKVPLGLNLEGFPNQPTALEARPFTVGYLARNCPEKGLHLAINAFRLLAEQVGKQEVFLKVAGYLSPSDKSWLDQLKRDLRAWGLADRVHFAGEVTRAEKVTFLSGLHAFTVPAPYREPKGLYVLEAMACGVPVVQPEHGAFVEMIQATGGGLLVEPHKAETVAEALKTLMESPSLRARLGARGQTAVHQDFNDHRMAVDSLAVFRRYLAGSRQNDG